ncbi:radical SAM protein [archaeon]|nr:radical SAM protein [archaeon]
METKIKEKTKVMELDHYNFLIDTTNSCQLDCIYCYKGHEKNTQKMDVKKVWNTVNSFLKSNSQLRSFKFHFMGGEPLIAWSQMRKLNSLAKDYSEKNNLSFGWGATSNLILLDEEKKEVFIKEKASIHCSIDGPKKIHNQNRPYANGRGSFLDVEKNIPLALAITPNDTARVTVTPKSANNLLEISEFLLDKGFKKVGLFPVFDMEWTNSEMKIWSNEIAKSMAKFGPDKITTFVRNRGEREIFSYCGAGKSL